MLSGGVRNEAGDIFVKKDLNNLDVARMIRPFIAHGVYNAHDAPVYPFG